MKKPKIKPPPNWEDTRDSFKNFEELARVLITTSSTKLKPEAAKKSKPKDKHHGSK